MNDTLPHCLATGEVAPRSDWRMPAHRHQHHEIIVVMSGRMKVCIRDEIISAAAGDVLFYHSKRRHEEWSDPIQPVRTIFTAFHLSAPLDWLPVLTTDSGDRVRHLADWMLQDRLFMVDPASGNIWLRALLQELRRLCSAETVPWLEAVRSHMRQHLHEALDLGLLARVAEMSRFTLVRKYRKTTGRTPMADLRRMRLEQARTLLLASAMPLKAIAPAVGIGDEFQLSKLFRRQFGLSPREARSFVSRRGDPQPQESPRS